MDNYVKSKAELERDRKMLLENLELEKKER